MFRYAAAALLLALACSAPRPSQQHAHVVTLAVAADAPETLPLSSGDAVRGRSAFIELQCHTCHRVAEDPSLPAVDGAWDGPLLHDLHGEPAEAVGWKIVTRTRLDAEAIFESVMVEPASSMTEQQLVDLIAYLRDPEAARRSR